MTNHDNNILSTTEMANIRTAYQHAYAVALELEASSEILRTETTRLLRRLRELNGTLPTFDLPDDPDPDPTAAS